MSSLVRRIQIRVLRNKNVDPVPIMDNVLRNRANPYDKQLVETRWPFTRSQIAFLGERRLFKGDKVPTRYRQLFKMIEADAA